MIGHVHCPSNHEKLGTKGDDKVAKKTTTRRSSECVNADSAHFRLPRKKWKRFCERLDAPPKSIPALRRLLTTGNLAKGSLIISEISGRTLGNPRRTSS